MEIDLREALRVMESAVRHTGEMLLMAQKDVQVVVQDYKDFVTTQDFASERIILDILAAEYPDVPAYSEESGGDPSTRGYLWVIDPIDGTLNYFGGRNEGENYWGVSIALVRDGQSVAGVLFFPNEDKCFSVARDGIGFFIAPEASTCASRRAAR